MKTTLQYDHYFDYAEMKEGLLLLQKQHPSLMHLQEEALTHEGRSIFSVTISSGKDPALKPAFYMDACTHAGEVAGSMACMYFMDALLTNSHEEKIHKLLENNTVYIIPRISPDGTEEYLKTSSWVRSINHPYPKDQSDNHGLFTKDLDQDNRIGMMRIPSASGAWKKREDHPFLMRRRRPDDTEGEFFNIYQEGMMDAYDGAHISVARTLYGMDFNRNFPISWMPDAKQPGAGKYPLCETETKVMADFILAHRNICAVLTMHTSGGALLHPPGTHSENSADEEDMRMYKEIGSLADDVLKYPTCNLFDSYCVDPAHFDAGAFDDWCYLQNGIPAFTMEIWNIHEKAGCKPQWPVDRDKTEKQEAEEVEKIYAWLKNNASETITPWHPYDHPQFGMVELGGMDYKFSVQNPPKQFLQEELEKIFDFSFRYAKTLPHLVMEKPYITKAAEGIYRIEINLCNTGYMPTWLSNEAKALQEDRKIQISAEGCRIIEGTKEVDGLAGYFNINTFYSYGGNIMTVNHAPFVKKLSFLVEAKPGDHLTVTVSHERAGTVTSEVIID